MSTPTLAAPARTPDTAGLPFVDGLARHGDRTALVEAETGRTLTYRALAARVDQATAQLPTGRRLVLVALDRSLDAVVTYLATLAAGHVALLTGPDPAQQRRLADTYRPQVEAGRRDGGWSVRGVAGAPEHDLHPDLAVLLSTSGSTGSPKLVRLSAANLQSNAEQIWQALDVGTDDRAITTLPLTYSYGLSVLHSHLLAGASLVLSERSVVDAGFWDAMAKHEVTSLPAVPYTFDLLDRVGFAGMALPALRHVTSAGGRLAPAQVRRYADLGAAHGFRLHVMYGQTEATARIATLDPSLARSRPDAIGRPVPGGSITLDAVDEDGVGEIVYRGPNVMLGYATSPADLARGRTVDALHTGDLARQNPDGTFTVAGRRARTAKVFGLRIDLDQVEQQLAERGVAAAACSTETGICVVAEGRIDGGHLADLAARASGLPLHVVGAHVVDALPRLPSGKLDRSTACATCDRPQQADPSPAAPPAASAEAARTAASPAASAEDVRALYARLLGRPDAGVDDSFVRLGGDSLSFVEVSVRVEALLGALPDDWHTLSPADLAQRAQPPRRRALATLETGVLLRAAAITAIVGTHIGAFRLLGGAHVLLGLAGFSMARFLLDPGRPGVRGPGVLRGAVRVALPSAAWIAVAALATGQYSWANVALVNTFVGPQEFGPGWHFWFVEALVLFLLSCAALMSIPAVDRWERRAPFVFAGIVVAVGLAARHGLVPGFDDPRPYPASGFYFFWFFALGWWAARASSTRQRLLVSAVVLLSVPGYWQLPARELAVIAGFLLLIWVPTVRVPRLVVPALSAVGAASLAIYLTHWVVFPPLQQRPWLALAACLVAGVAIYTVSREAMKLAKSRSFWSAYACAYSAKARSARSPVPR